MYKTASKFRQSAPHSAVGRDQSLVPAQVRTASPKYAKIMRWLRQNSEPCGATELIKSLSDWDLARLIVAMCTETSKPNDWLYNVCIAVDDRLNVEKKDVRLSLRERRVAETVIPEIINRARTSAEWTSQLISGQKKVGLVSSFFADIYVHLRVELAHVPALKGRFVGGRQRPDPIERCSLAQFERLEAADPLELLGAFDIGIDKSVPLAGALVAPDECQCRNRHRVLH